MNLKVTLSRPRSRAVASRYFRGWHSKSHIRYEIQNLHHFLIVSLGITLFPLLRSCLEPNGVLFRDEAPDQADEIPSFKTALDYIRICPDGISVFLIFR